MGVIRAGNLETVGQSNAAKVDGGLRFNSAGATYLSRTPASAGNRTTFTFSCWVKLTNFGSNQTIFAGWDGSASNQFEIRLNSDNTFFLNTGGESGNRTIATTAAVFRDPSAWYHLVCAVDTTQASASDHFKFYINNSLQTLSLTASGPQNLTTQINGTFLHHVGVARALTRYFNGYLADIHFIDGQALTPSSFGYTDPLTNTWRPKKYTGTFTGTNTFYLPFDGNTPIGQDRSGNNNNWTPVNFGGSNTIEKATGALPILNTDGGGKVARVGVRTDSNASSLVLALPLVGIKSDFSNAVNSGTSNKAITVSGSAAASSTQSNFYGGSFYFDGTGDYLSIPSSSDFAFGTGDFTIEFHSFFAASSLPANATFYSNNYTGTQGVLIQSSSAALYFYVASSSVYTGNVLVAQKWQHIAITRSSGTISIFVDGVLQASGTLSGSAGNSSVGVTIAAGSNGGTGFELNGYIQDFRIYKGLAKYTQNFIPASTDPDILPDTPSGVSYSSNVALVPSTDGSFFFSGPNSAIQDASPGYTVGTSAYTFECWAMARSWGDSSIIGLFGFQFGRYASNNGIGIAYASWELYTDWLPSTNLWYHYAITRDGSGVTRLFINGNLEVSATINTNYGAPTTAAVGGGPQSTPLNGFDGFISNARFVLGSALYTAKFTPSSTPLESTGAQTKFLGCQSNSSTSSIAVNSGTVSVKGTINASNFNPFTVNINTQRGQESGYPTLNPLDKPSSASVTISNGNLRATDGNSGSYSLVVSNAGLSTSITDTGYYLEVTNLKTTSGNSAYTGFSFWRVGGGTYNNLYPPGTATYNPNNGYTYSQNGGVIPWGGSTVSSQPTWQTAGDVFSVAVKGSNVWFAKNGVWISGNPATGTSPYTTIPSGYGQVFPAALALETGDQEFNFGQKPFKFPPPAGFQPLALSNIPRPTIVRPDQYVGIVTYTGNDSNPRSFANLGWKPDFIWIKNRSQSYNHVLFDSVRGAGGSKVLFSNRTTAEGGGAGEEGTAYGHISSFDNYGFTVNTGTTSDIWVNNNTENYVAWAWKAGGNSNTYNINDIGYSTASAAGLTAGTITPTGASVNTKSGFSIIGYNGAGTNSALTSTISHGLTQAPTFMIVKARTGTNAADDWFVYHKSIGPTKRIRLNLTNVADTQTWMGDTEPTSSLITLNQGWYSVNYTGHTHILYAWHDVPGFSKFGSYTGNGSSDGPMVVTGFRPRWILLRETGNADYWFIFDTERSKTNPTAHTLWADQSQVENWTSINPDTTYNNMDILSNGFKLRSSYSATNRSSGNYIYAAFAETPSFNLYGGQSNAR